jgi:hypothetical protein
MYTLASLQIGHGKGKLETLYSDECTLVFDFTKILFV